jgi:adenylylsulfate kinase
VAEGRGVVVFVTGRPSAGKSTLAERLHAELGRGAGGSVLLDGDAVRAALVPAPGYGESERASFYETLAGLAALIARQGSIVIVAATAHQRAFRQRARELSPCFVEVFVDTPAEECARRDAKGLYERARRNDVADLPGANLAYEEPESPDVIAAGGHDEAALASVKARLGFPP